MPGERVGLGTSATDAVRRTRAGTSSSSRVRQDGRVVSSTRGRWLLEAGSTGCAEDGEEHAEADGHKPVGRLRRVLDKMKGFPRPSAASTAASFDDRNQVGELLVDAWN